MLLRSFCCSRVSFRNQNNAELEGTETHIKMQKDISLHKSQGLKKVTFSASKARLEFSFSSSVFDYFNKPWNSSEIRLGTLNWMNLLLSVGKSVRIHQKMSKSFHSSNLAGSPMCAVWCFKAIGIFWFSRLDNYRESELQLVTHFVGGFCWDGKMMKCFNRMNASSFKTPSKISLTYGLMI